MESNAFLRVDVPGVVLGWVMAEGCQVDPSAPELLDLVQTSAQAAMAARDSEESALRKTAVRDLLRHGAYKPTGRGKPASEYLLNAAAAGAFPVINSLVDINNLVSVESLLPISLVDLDLAGADGFSCRRGRPEEAYVFNPSGQVLDLHDLLLLARVPGDAPCATPVKDSQATKTHPGTKRVLGVIYAPPALAREAEAAALRMGGLMARFCGASVRTGTARHG